MLIFYFRKKISSENSQLSKEINFEILFRNLEHVLFCEISQKKFHLWSTVIDWSVGQCLQTSNEASTMGGFRTFISNVKVLTFERKISKFLFQNRISKLIFNVKRSTPYDLWPGNRKKPIPSNKKISKEVNCKEAKNLYSAEIHK